MTADRFGGAAPDAAPRSAPPVTADDVDLAVGLSVSVLRAMPAEAWDEPAGTLDWTRWETVEHIADDLFAYAAQLGPRKPPLDGPVPFVVESRRPGGPANAFAADRAAGTDGLLQVLEACGGLLAAMVRVTPPTVRAHHIFGRSDPEGFAAMGVVETVVHTHDLVLGLGLDATPPADLCARVLARLFPDVPPVVGPWPALLWATGRLELPGHPRRGRWRWYAEPAG